MKKNLTDEKLKEDEIEKTISILWIISNKTNSNKKNNDQIWKKNKLGLFENLEGQMWKSRRREIKRKKVVVGVKLKVSKLNAPP
jgi:hypothetical protein